MDPSREEWSQKCACGKRFFQPNSYTHHIQGCASYKKGVGSSLEGARARWAAKAARPKKGTEAISAWYGQRDLDVDHDISRPVAGPSTPIVELRRAETPPPEQSGRGFRVIKPVERYGADFEATSTMLFHFVPESPSSTTAGTSAVPTRPSGLPIDNSIPVDVKKRQSILDEDTWKSTRTSPFGLWKRYWTLEDRPHNPESHISSLDLIDDGEPEDESIIKSSGGKTTKQSHTNRYHPFPNLSSYLLGQWFWSEEQKSRESLYLLIDILTSEGFKPEDLLFTNWTSISASLASSEFEESTSEGMWVEDGESWQTSPVTIDVPFNSTSSNPGSFPFTIEGFRFRPLISVVRAKLQDSGHSEQFHFVPYDLRWLSHDCTSDTRIYGEMYHSQAFLDAYREVQSLPPEPSEDHLPRYVVGLMFASDQTMLASFGDAKLWPVYMLYGNESKHRRSRVSLGLFEEIAYFRTLPDDFTDWYLNRSGKKTWKILLDDEFVRAYRHGMVIDCFDGVRRRFYPRIMTYSADYPERKNRGRQYPGDIPALGQPSDRHLREARQRSDDLERQAKVDKAREMIYGRKHLAVNSKPVEAILKPTSLVPTKNAFSERLFPDGFDMHGMVVVDILHEVEIGVWKSLFIHLLRILEAENPALVNILDQRYRQVPTFGKDTIRRFSSSVSLQKQLAARNYEDMLQCAVPVFEGLLPANHDLRVHNLLFTLGHWHALAKMRMHTDFSLHVLDQWTTILGEDARAFIELTCTEFETRELKREFEARKRAQARRAKKASTSGKGGSATEPTQSREGSAITGSQGGDRASTKATSSSGPGSKAKKPQQSKRGSTAEKDAVEGSGLAEGDGRQPRTWNINTPKFHALGDVVSCIRRFGTTDSYSTQLGFLLKLKLHLMPRVIEELLRESRMDPEQYGRSIPTLEALSQSFKADDANYLHFHSDRIYRHRIFKLRFTTYDCRADHDIFNPSTSRRDFMCIRGDAATGEGSALGDNDRYRYGRILGVFHANVMYSGPGALDNRRRRFDFLWVRWFVPQGCGAPWTDKTHDVVSLARAGSPDACSFLDPEEVLRAAHIIPRFSAGPLYESQDGPRNGNTPVFSRCAQDRSDWKEYLVNRFVDRDMVMRFHDGLTPGHSSVPHSVRVSSSDSPMEWETEPGLDNAIVDTHMTDESPTDSEDSEYDALPVADHLSEQDGEGEGEGEGEGVESDVPDPDSDLDSADVFT
ncbi:hypothetical protein NMY22_g6600 [Coprinellus aureogranulatus]|nr:hypothetical protein NMY22_g6600 [Coprinellus aureogranulatus]